ncbi:hypothetical protein KI387_031523, partial [Taxus chinensis]
VDLEQSAYVKMVPNTQLGKELEAQQQEINLNECVDQHLEIPNGINQIDESLAMLIEDRPPNWMKEITFNLGVNLNFNNEELEGMLLHQGLINSQLHMWGMSTWEGNCKLTPLLIPQLQIQHHPSLDFENDIIENSAAGSYATSLAELAQSVKSLDAISRDIDKLSQYITNKDFFNFLVNPIIPDKKKKGILEDITNDAKFQPYTLNFLYILIDKKRIALIGEIFKEFETVYNKLTDIELVVVSSVVKLENQISLGPSQNQCN